MVKEIDYLKEDEPIPNQSWICISFLSPEGIKNCNVRGLKLRGVYATKEEADHRAQALQKIDPDFHVFVGEMGKWLPWDPDPNDVQDQIYQEKELQSIMKGYKDNLSKAKEMQSQRKDMQIKEAAKSEQTRAEKTRERLQEKLAARKKGQETEKKMEEIVTPQVPSQLTESEIKTRHKESVVQQKEELAKIERERLDQQQKLVQEKEQTLESIDAKMERIRQLYKKANKKE